MLGELCMKNKTKKMIAPIVITVLITSYYFIFFGIIINIVNNFWSIFLGIIPLIFAIAMIFVCIERIREIQGGEEDDISKY
jgi:ABC-type multidrug transport system permease subunit